MEPEGILEPGVEAAENGEKAQASILETIIDQDIARLPKVTIQTENTPPDLLPARFLKTMVTRVLGATPVNMHEQARQRRIEARQTTG